MHAIRNYSQAQETSQHYQWTITSCTASSADICAAAINVFKTDRPIKTTPLANTLFIELLDQSGDTARLHRPLHRPNITCRFGKPAFYSRKTEDLAVEAVTILSSANDG